MARRARGDHPREPQPWPGADGARASGSASPSAARGAVRAPLHGGRRSDAPLRPAHRRRPRARSRASSIPRPSTRRRRDERPPPLPAPGSRAAGGLGLVMAVVAVGALFVGSAPVPPGDVLAVLTGRGTARVDQVVVLSLRLPRIPAALLAGGALAVAGAGFQALTRNPLAEPSVLGVSSGAAFGVVAGPGVRASGGAAGGARAHRLRLRGRLRGRRAPSTSSRPARRAAGAHAAPGRGDRRHLLLLGHHRADLDRGLRPAGRCHPLAARQSRAHPAAAASAVFAPRGRARALARPRARRASSICSRSARRARSSSASTPSG